MTVCTIFLNGEAHQLPQGTTIAELVRSVSGSARGSAVVVDGAVVPRGQWEQLTLAPDQRVELITAVQGG